MGYNWCSASVLSATLCFHSALSAILWFQPHAAAPNATLKTNGFFDARGQFMVPEAANLWVQSHNYEGPQGAGYHRWFHKSPLFYDLYRLCRLTEFVTILAGINDKTRQSSWQNPTWVHWGLVCAARDRGCQCVGGSNCFSFFGLCSIKVSGWNGHYETMGAGAETSRQSRPFEW
jgi:hypothetical protein